MSQWASWGNGMFTDTHRKGQVKMKLYKCPVSSQLVPISTILNVFKSWWLTGTLEVELRSEIVSEKTSLMKTSSPGLPGAEVCLDNKGHRAPWKVPQPTVKPRVDPSCSNITSGGTNWSLWQPRCLWPNQKNGQKSLKQERPLAGGNKLWFVLLILPLSPCLLSFQLTHHHSSTSP